jgi:hypothetical protein
MALSNFDLTKLLRCSAMNEEAYTCLRPPSHEGSHRWDRCETTNSDGHRCMLSLSHGGSHQLVWYDRPAAPGEMHTINYGGTERDTVALADRAARIAASYGWVRQSYTFRPGLFWRSPTLAGWLSGLTAPHGRLAVLFEFRPPGDTQA